MKRRRRQAAPPKPSPGAAAGYARRSPFRVPFVRKCRIEFSDGRSRSVFIANINEYGAYLADDEMPETGQGATLRFRTPGSEAEIEATGAVAWLNPRQQHPVHSLPPGYGVRFDPLREPGLQQVLAIVRAFVGRQSGG